MEVIDNTEILTEDEIEQCRKEAEDLARIEADVEAERAEQDWIDEELVEVRAELEEDSRSEGGAYFEAHKEGLRRGLQRRVRGAAKLRPRAKSGEPRARRLRCIGGKANEQAQTPQGAQDAQDCTEPDR
jgi:hypothetical protein